MLVLSITRDGGFCGQVAVAEGLRLGRDPENDVVLEDSARGVSRFHAELRSVGNGVLLLTDLQSANGTWVGGERVESAEVQMGTPFTIGPYHLVLEDVDNPGVVEDHPGGFEPVAPVAEPAAALAHPPGPPPAPAGLLANPRLMLGGAGALLLGGILAGSMLSGSPSGDRGRSDAGVEQLLDDAQAAARDGDVGTALDLVDQVLAIDAENPEAVALRERLDPPEPPPSQPLPPSPVTTAPPDVPPPPVAIRPPPPARPSPPSLSVVEVSGLSRLPNESPTVYSERVRRAQSSLAEASSLLRAGRFAEADRLAAAVVAANPEFREARELVVAIQAERARAVEQAHGRAAAARQGGDLLAEAEALVEVKRLDAQADVSARESDLRRQMEAAGEKAFTEGTVYENSERFDLARSAYGRAVRLLPAGHPRRALAEQYLKQLGG
jgi:tetratricopeptide (TPR) repeat protein